MRWWPVEFALAGWLTSIGWAAKNSVAFGREAERCGGTTTPTLLRKILTLTSVLSTINLATESGTVSNWQQVDAAMFYEGA